MFSCPRWLTTTFMVLGFKIGPFECVLNYASRFLHSNTTIPWEWRNGAYHANFFFKIKQQLPLSTWWNIVQLILFVFNFNQCNKHSITRDQYATCETNVFYNLKRDFVFWDYCFSQGCLYSHTKRFPVCWSYGNCVRKTKGQCPGANYQGMYVPKELRV